MIDSTEYIFEMINKELGRQHRSPHSLVLSEAISGGEYNYTKKHLIDGKDFSPKLDFVVRVCDSLNMTPNDMVKELSETKNTYATESEEKLIRAVMDMNEEDVFQIANLVQMIDYARKHQRAKKEWNDNKGSDENDLKF